LWIVFFVRGIYNPDVNYEAFECAGFSIDSDGLKKVGTDKLHEKYLFKIREGFSFDSLCILKTILEISTPLGIVQEPNIRSTISRVKDLFKKFSFL
jgi:aldehyde:ferredoxin oxidoreductase